MKTTARAKCTYKGCNEWANWSFATRKECSDHYPSRLVYKCTRHTKPESVLSTSRTKIETVLTAGRSEVCRTGVFWKKEGETLASECTYGPGFKAYADDFPEGTKIKITAEIILP